jgi:hypothetical protein
MPGNRRANYLRKRIVKYIYVGRASCPGVGGLNIYVCFEIYLCRKGFMPGKRRVKYLRKGIVKYIYVGRAKCPGIGG